MSKKKHSKITNSKYVTEDCLRYKTRSVLIAYNIYHMSGYSRVTWDALIDDRKRLERYACSYCKFLVRNAVQPSCGHWMCEECAKELFNSDRHARIILIHIAQRYTMHMQIMYLFSRNPHCPTCSETLTSDDEGSQVSISMGVAIAI